MQILGLVSLEQQHEDVPWNNSIKRHRLMMQYVASSIFSVAFKRA